MFLDSPLVSSLMAVYQEETGDKIPAMSSGGATFARTRKIVSPFSSFPGAEHRAPPMNAKIEDLYAAEIYREAYSTLSYTVKIWKPSF